MPMLIEEASQRARDQVESLLGLLSLSFEAGLADARELSRITRGPIDPVATCCFVEARELLLCAEPDVATALMALQVAATREPLCYGATHRAVCELLFTGIQASVDAELSEEHEAMELPLKSAS